MMTLDSSSGFQGKSFSILTLKPSHLGDEIPSDA